MKWPQRMLHHLKVLFVGNGGRAAAQLDALADASAQVRTKAEELHIGASWAMRNGQTLEHLVRDMQRRTG